MYKRKIFLDVLFILISTSILVALHETGAIVKYIGLVLLPIIGAYYLGQFVERKKKKNNWTQQ